jgi:hypothetical protein
VNGGVGGEVERNASGVSRAQVNAEARRLVQDHTPETVQAACKVYGWYSLSEASETDDQIIEAAGAFGVPGADVAGLVNGLVDAKNSRDEATATAVYLICGSA